MSPFRSPRAVKRAGRLGLRQSGVCGVLQAVSGNVVPLGLLALQRVLKARDGAYGVLICLVAVDELGMVGRAAASGSARRRA